MGMSFKELQDAVLADGFSEAKRGDCKNWIIARHAWLWDLEEWQFRFGTASVGFTASSQIVGAMPSDFAIALAVYDSSGQPLRAMRDLRLFLDQYNAGLANGTGSPEAFTVIGGQLMVGPAGDGSSGTLLYEKSKPVLDGDDDTTGLPDGYDLALVYGGKAEGFKLTNVPLYQSLDDDFTAATNALRRNYLTGVRGQVGQMGAFRPGQWR